MRIQLVWPILDNQPVTSIGLGYLAAAAKAAGHEVSLIQLNETLGYPLDLDRIKSDLRAFRPGLLGFSSVSNQYEVARRVAAAVRREADLGDLPIIIGGPHATIFPEECVSESCFDYVCVGEGDRLLPELASRLERCEDPSNLPGLWSSRNGEVVRNPLDRPIGNTDDLPFMDLSIFDMERILPLRNGWLEVQMTRGCPYECHYCIQHYLRRLYRDSGYRLGKASVSRFVENLETLARLYPGIRLFNVNDETFTLGKRRVQEFCDLYRARIFERSGIGFNIQTRPDHFDQEMAAALAGAGCRIAKFGVESGSERVRRELLNRPEVSDERLEETFATAHQAGLESWAFNMIGIPGESPAELMATFELNGRLKPDNFWLSIYFPYHRTPLYDLCRELGILVDERWLSLPNYRTDTCLRLPGFDDFEIAKIYRMANWYLNRAAFPGLAQVFDPLIERFRRIPREKWRDEEVASLNRELADRFRWEGVSHYEAAFSHISVKRMGK